jgi:xyloglucan 6-xylosyltransferase
MRTSQYNAIYIICATVAACTYVMWRISSQIDINGFDTDFTQGAGGEEAPDEVRRLLTEIDQKLQRILKSNKKFTKFGPRIEDWDAQREIAKSKKRSNAANQSSESSKPLILLITSSHPHSCEHERGDEMLLKSIKNKMDYCRLHDIELFYNLDKIDDEMNSWWVKVFLTHMLMLKHPEVDWIWWMDSDAIFTDMSFEIPFHKYANHNMVMHGWDDAVYDKRSWIGLNAGVFILRNCQWSMDLLHAWAPMGPKGAVRNAIGPLLSKALPGRLVNEADDQSALAYLMLTDREKWGSKVYLENSYYFQGYWRLLTEKFEEMMAKYKPGLYGDERWPFITHFVGCEFCEGAVNPEYSSELCISQMERAVNFADNQVLSLYGFKHPTLRANSVRPVARQATTSLFVSTYLPSSSPAPTSLQDLSRSSKDSF